MENNNNIEESKYLNPLMENYVVDGQMNILDFLEIENEAEKESQE